MSGKLTHLDNHGKARMVDVSHKQDSLRIARAMAYVSMQQTTLQLIAAGGPKKGDVLTVARIAGIQAAKRCAELIPLCHPLQLSAIHVELVLDHAQKRVVIETECRVNGATGVEMEAMTAAATAALTIYDMCKSVDRGMVIEGVRLLHKSGGQSGDWHADSET